jgi:hypothetical protein
VPADTLTDVVPGGLLDSATRPLTVPRGKGQGAWFTRSAAYHRAARSPRIAILARAHTTPARPAPSRRQQRLRILAAYRVAWTLPLTVQTGLPAGMPPSFLSAVGEMSRGVVAGAISAMMVSAVTPSRVFLSMVMLPSGPI